MWIGGQADRLAKGPSCYLKVHCVVRLPRDTDLFGERFKKYSKQGDWERLLELADWIEYRTATISGKASPADLARIELGRNMADEIDRVFKVHSQTVVALHARVVELEQACAASFHDMREVLNNGRMEVREMLIGVDTADGPDQTGIAHYQVPVANTPGEPVEVHECSTLAFDHEIHTGILKVRCNLGRCRYANL